MNKRKALTNHISITLTVPPNTALIFLPVIIEENDVIFKEWVKRY